MTVRTHVRSGVRAMSLGNDGELDCKVALESINEYLKWVSMLSGLGSCFIISSSNSLLRAAVVSVFSA